MSGLWWNRDSTSSGFSTSPKWIEPGAGAHEDHAPLDAVVEVVPGQVAELDAGERRRTSP